MALFKIKRGLAATLPTTYVEGYCYFTTDDGKFYIDTTNTAAGRITLNAYKADILRTARNLQVDLESTSYVSFDGSVDRKNIGISGILGVANGGTGKSTHTANAVLTGNGTSAVKNVATASGALYATATNGAPKFGTLPIAQGGTGLTANPSMLINLASNSAASVLAASPRPGVTGTLAVGNGGTGKTSWTANALIYAATTTSLGQIDLGTSGYVLQSNGSDDAPSWINATNSNTASTIVKRDGSGNFSAGTITATFAGNGASLTALNASNISSGTVAAARLPTATTSALGIVKIGSNITVSSGTISLSKSNVTTALGYTPNTPTEVDNKIAAVVNSAPETLNTLKELATALGNDANFSTTVTNLIATKISSVTASGTAPLTLNASTDSTTKAVTISGSIANASTSAAGVVTTGAQSFAGNKMFTGDILLHMANTDRSIVFSYVNSTTVSPGASWRLAGLGSGSGDTNYFAIQSGTSGTTGTEVWNNVIRLSQNTFDAAFGGNLYPLTNDSKTLGTSSYKWAGVYATTFYGALSGNATTATSAGAFTSAASVTLTGDVTGTASSTKGWSVATTLANSGVTAGSYGPSANASPAHGGTFSVPYITFDAKGRATAASTKTITLPTYTIGNATITIKAGTGLATGGSFTTNQTSAGTITLNHSNSITAGSVGSAQSPSHGGTFAIPKITYDAQGHITAATTVNITLPSDNNTLNTAGSSNTSSKIFLVGATSQASSAQTYSHDTAYVGTDGHLYSNSQKVLNATNYTDYAVPLIEGSTSGSYTVYRALGNLYKGSAAVTYYRIALPQATSWGMIMIKLAIREKYSNGSAGEIIIYANHSSTAEWNTFYASCIGNLSTNIKVYGSDKKYLYINGDFSYSGLSVELMTVGDSAAGVNLSNITIDTVTALPTTYQTATMLYSLHSGNYTSYTVTKTGTGASGTWGISISGTAAAAPWSGITGKPSYYDAKAIKSITRSGTTFTATHLDGTTSTFTQQDNNTTYTFTNKAATLSWGTTTTIATVGGTNITVALPANPNSNTAHAHAAGNGITLTGSGGTSGTTTIALSDSFTVSGTITAGKVVGAVWNDYAEYRWVLKHPDTDEPIQAGRCVAENGNDSMSLTNARLQAGVRIVSDTYGMCMGETEKAKTPVAVCGRVLAYPFERKVAFNVGDPVCSGPNGTVSKMSREEAMMYPERIVGTVVSKPTYKEWGPNKIPVNGRIWIQVR